MLIACLGLASRAWAEPEQSNPPVAAFPDEPPAKTTVTPPSSGSPVEPFAVAPVRPGLERAHPVEVPAPPERDERDERDGFFFHVALGGALIGVGNETVGAGASETLLVGGTPAGSLVLGGALAGGVFDLDRRTTLLAMIGPFVQFYADRNETLYLRVLAGDAIVSEGSSEAQHHPAIGLGIGVEGRLAKAWKIGPLLHLLLSGIDRSDDGGHGNARPRARLLFVPTFSLGITSH